MKTLVIVESPNKCSSIKKILGNKFDVIATSGHIKELSLTGEGNIGIDIENNFKPIYRLIPKKRKYIDNLKKKSKMYTNIIIATDNDREGETIAHHISNLLRLDIKSKNRITFNEISDKAILDSLSHKRKIDLSIVASQETRRIVDRLIGFQISPIVKKNTTGTSAGRVQSVALKVICDREREIEKFNSSKYYNIELDIKGQKFIMHDNSGYVKIDNIEDAKKIESEITSLKFKKNEIKQIIKYPLNCFNTSSLQQHMNKRYNFSANYTMKIAQKLYEGNIKNINKGIITYIRTDSTNVSNSVYENVKKIINKEFDSTYIDTKKFISKTKDQFAHEAIRPTNFDITPTSLENILSREEHLLYKEIYYRTLAYFMKPAKNNNVITYIIDNNGNIYKNLKSYLVYDGYKIALDDTYEKNNFTISQIDYSNITIFNSKIKEINTKPKPRYTEAKLINFLEKIDVGRPSTYANIVSTLKNRKYITLNKNKIIPTLLGNDVSTFLNNHFTEIINLNYTRILEKQLDMIALNRREKVSVLSDFHNKLVKSISNIPNSIPKKSTTVKCDICNNLLTIRKSKYGKFLGCTNYPKCKFTKKLS